MAHMYETGRMRRVHLRGHSNIIKRLLIHACGLNLGLLMRALCGVGTPRGFQGSSYNQMLAALRMLILAHRSRTDWSFPDKRNFSKHRHADSSSLILLARNAPPLEYTYLRLGLLASSRRSTIPCLRISKAANSWMCCPSCGRSSCGRAISEAPPSEI